MTVPATAPDIELVEGFWAALGRRDFDADGASMADDGPYVDVPVIALDPGSYGPAETAARLCSPACAVQTNAPSTPYRKQFHITTTH